MYCVRSRAFDSSSCSVTDARSLSQIPAQSLHPPDQDGYLTKQGGSIRTWKRRYFILKDRTLYYYKTPKVRLRPLSF